MIVSLPACKRTPTHSKIKIDTSIKVSKPDTPHTVKKDTIPTYTLAVYKSYIPKAVNAMLEEKLPGWKLPSPDTWEKYWFNAYKKDNALVDYVNGNFNGDGKPDYALLLENDQHAFIIWVLQSGVNDYKAIELKELTEATSPLNIGLELIGKGKLNYLSMNENADDIKTLDLKYQAIQVSYFEASAETFYWKNGKYQSVTTGD